ncbi:Protein arg-6, mitochondrial [Metarhizium anisopliae]
MQCLSIVMPPNKDRAMAYSGYVDHHQVWLTVRESDENLTCVFEKPDGSFNNNGSVLFYYGCDLPSDALAPFQSFNMPLNKTMTSRDIRQIYQDRYAGEKLVDVVGEAPLLKNVMNKHGVELHDSHMWQHRQLAQRCCDTVFTNMNLALECAEDEGIPTM